MANDRTELQVYLPVSSRPAIGWWRASPANVDATRSRKANRVETIAIDSA